MTQANATVHSDRLRGLPLAEFRHELLDCHRCFAPERCAHHEDVVGGYATGKIAVVGINPQRDSFLDTQADQLLFDQFIAEAKQDQEIVDRALANPLDNFELSMKPKVEGLMIDRMDQNQEIVARYLNDPAFQSAAFKALVKRIYREIRRESSRPPSSPP